MHGPRITDDTEPRETARLEAFSDGVMAIAITLLILHIAVPPLSAGETLADAILRLWPSYLAYLVSFSTILVMWLHHHTLFRIIVRVDHRLLLINGLLLLLITFVNFPTAVLADYAQTPHRETAAAFYNGTFVLLAVAFLWLWRSASANFRLLDRTVDPAFVASITRSYSLGPAVYLIAFLVAFLNAWASLAIDAVLAGYWAFTAQPGATILGPERARAAEWAYFARFAFRRPKSQTPTDPRATTPNRASGQRSGGGGTRWNVYVTFASTAWRFSQKTMYGSEPGTPQAPSRSDAVAL